MRQNSVIKKARSPRVTEPGKKTLVTRSYTTSKSETTRACVDSALEYASRGLPVLPIWWTADNGSCACKKSDCPSPGKHPVGTLVRRGLKDGTTDPDIIHRWFAKEPQANIGIITGAISGIVVVDIDDRHGGNRSLERLEKAHGSLPPTVEALTGGGGRHLLFAVRVA